MYAGLWKVDNRALANGVVHTTHELSCPMPECSSTCTDMVSRQFSTKCRRAGAGSTLTCRRQPYCMPHLHGLSYGERTQRPPLLIKPHRTAHDMPSQWSSCRMSPLSLVGRPRCCRGSNMVPRGRGHDSMRRSTDARPVGRVLSYFGSASPTAEVRPSRDHS